MNLTQNQLTVGRRGFLAGALGSAAMLALAACSSSSNTAATSTGSAGTGSQGFTWTDARGRTIDLKSRPSRVVAQSSAAASLWDAGFKVTGVYGELGVTDGKLSYQDGNLSTDGLAVLGKTYGEFNVEQYAATRPELLVDLCFDDKSLWYIPQTASAQVDKLAPSIAMKMTDRKLPDIIAEFTKLAGDLGADVNSVQVTAAKRQYDAALDAVRKAAAAKPKLRVLAVSRNTDKAYFADASQQPDLAQLTDLGVNFIEVKGKAGEYFVLTSWEQIGKYPADVIIYDARETAAVTKAADAMPVWKDLPAVKAGQVHPWYPAAPYSYAAYGPLYSQVADWLTSAKVLSA